MSESSKKAWAVLFTVLVLLGVGAWIATTLERGLKYVVRVQDIEIDDGLVERRLLSEEIIQGTQLVKPADPNERDLSRLPTAYWHPRGPFGEIFGGFNGFRDRDNVGRGDLRLPASLVAHGCTPAAPLGQLAALWSEPPIGVVQMKAGTVAGYARPYAIIDFYESNPNFIALSRPQEGAPKFSYLSDAERRGARARVFEGPEVESLKNGPKWFYQLLVVETARHGTAPAEELLTEEAFEAYMNALAHGGLLVMHVSGADSKIRQRIAQAAKEFGLQVRLAEDPGNPPRGPYPSDWLVMALRPQSLERFHTRNPAALLRWSSPNRRE